MNDALDDYDPFNAPLNPEEDQGALVAALRMLHGFGLFFAVTNSATERNRRMDSVAAEVANKKIQRVAVNSEMDNLLWHLREVLSDPKPDILFVYGLENWISGSVHPRSIPFLLNLNAARDSFPLLLPAPMVLWVPQYVLKAIADAAPDFFSVRSGVYMFPIMADERSEMSGTLTRIGHTEAMGYSIPERVTRIHELRGLLTEYQTLPESQRDQLSEADLMNSLGLQLHGEGQYEDALPLFEEALAIRRAILPYPHEDIATSLNNLAWLYDSQGQYDKALPLNEEALAIRRAVLPYPHNDIATSLNNLAILHQDLGQYDKALPLHEEALAILRAVLSHPHNDIATSLNNLAGLYQALGQYDKALPLHDESLAIRRAVLPYPHNSIATSLSNLATLYRALGRYGDALPLFEEALAIRRAVLPYPHNDIATSLSNLASLYDLQGKYNKALLLFDEGLKIMRQTLGETHVDTKRILKNYNRLLKKKIIVSVPSKSPPPKGFGEIADDFLKRK